MCYEAWQYIHSPLKQWLEDIYQSIWDAAIDGENLECFREVGNIHDPAPVASREDGSVVGHLPRALSAVCSSFICRGGLMLCRVSGSRRYSADLPQGGLEVPCVLTFQTSNAKDVEKAKKLINQESMSFSTLIKVGVIEKTEDLNYILSQSWIPVLTRVRLLQWKIMLRT